MIFFILITSYFFRIFSTPMRRVLDQNVKPEHYEIFISHLGDDFKGEVFVDIKILKKLDKFKINSVGLDIQECKIDGNKCEFSKEKDEEIEIKIGKYLEGNHKLNLKYSGKLSYNMEGFYVSQYKVKNLKKRLYSTHFEPTHARKFIPCFDQPDMKATFKLKIETEDFVVISNTKVIESYKVENNRKITVFDVTPKMSTYLLAVVIGELEFVEEYLNGTLIRVYTTEGKVRKESLRWILVSKL